VVEVIRAQREADTARRHAGELWADAERRKRSADEHLREIDERLDRGVDRGVLDE
jgi:hypothetical protein